MTDVIEFELDPDPGWYPLPEDDVDLNTWAHDFATQLLAADPAGDAVRSLAARLLEHGRLARENLVELAYVFLPDPAGPVLATCHIDLIFGTPGDLPSPAEVTASLRQRLPEHTGEPQVGERLLTAGRAVRQHAMRTEDAEVLESVVHVIWIPDLDDALLRISTAWQALALGEQLTERADRIAAMLIVRTS